MFIKKGWIEEGVSTEQSHYHISQHRWDYSIGYDLTILKPAKPSQEV